MNSYFSHPLVFIIDTLATLYITAVILRFLLPLVGADFHNPLSQFVVKVTAKPLHFLRRFVPSMGKVDTAAIVLALLLQLALLLVIFVIIGAKASPAVVMLWTVTGLLHTTLNLFLFAIIIMAVMSWVNPDPFNPMMRVLGDITNPIMKPIRNVVPVMGGFDISPLFAILAIQVLKMLIPAPFTALPF